MQPPTYSLDLARSALPLVRSIAEDRAHVRAELDGLHAEMARLRRQAQVPQGELNDLHRRTVEAEARLALLVAELAELGLTHEDERTGAVGFPGQMDDDEVVFVWTPFDDDVDHFRDSGDAPGTRRPLPVPVGT